MMKKLFLAAAVTVLWSGAAFAQHNTAVSNAGASSSLNTYSTAKAANNRPVTLNQGNNSPTYANTPSDVTVRSAPTLYVPSVITGNVCALGASGGASFIGAAVAFGGTWESEQCERRQKIAL